MESIQTDVVVIGAGVIGLAAAAQLAPHYSVIGVDQYPQFGRETSSRNSEVIHSGIHYGLDGKKTQWCIEGRELLYRFCADHAVPAARTGKYVVATSEAEETYLDRLVAHVEKLDVPFARRSGAEIQAAEPLLAVRSGVFFPRTGIVDSHALMAVLERQILAAGGLVAYQHRVQSIEKSAAGWHTELDTPDGPLRVESRAVVNAAGLAAAEWSNLALQTSRYEHRFCRGRYFALSSAYRGKFKALIYPVPQKDGLGVHVTVDMDGAARLGPDVEWSEVRRYADTDALYDCDWNALRPAFCRSVAQYLPGVGEHELYPGLIGIRPKLFVDGIARPDFLVENHEGFVHCLGIESPGLTSSLRIAQEVERLLRDVA